MQITVKGSFIANQQRSYNVGLDQVQFYPKELKMSNSNPKSTPITVHNKVMNEINEFSTMRKAAEFFDISHSQII